MQIEQVQMKMRVTWQVESFQEYSELSDGQHHSSDQILEKLEDQKGLILNRFLFLFIDYIGLVTKI